MIYSLETFHYKGQDNPLALTPNADFRKQDPIVSYPMVLMHEPQFLSALHYSFVAKGSCPFCQKIPFSFWPQAGLPHWTLWKRVFSISFGSAHI